jgi:hypothetical protein
MPSPKRILKRFTAWSYSRLAVYRECPFKACKKFLDKLPEPEGPALAKGTAMHKTCESFLKGEVKALPEMLKPFRNEVKDIKKFLVGTELQWAFSQDWKPTGWFDKNCWLRIVVDAASQPKPDLLLIDDWKSGRIYEDKQDQLDLYDLGGLLLNPEVKLVKSRFIYIDQGVIKENQLDRKDIEKAKTHWRKETIKMMLDTTFAPRPGDYCRFCYLRKSAGGPCKF